MAGGLLRASVTEITDQQVRRPDSDIQGRAFAGGLKMGHTRFDQVAVAIQFVFDLEIDLPLVWKMELVVGEKITIRSLGLTDKVDVAVHQSFQPW